MRVSASLGLVVIVASLAGCEQRNFDRCLPGNPDFQCADGKICQAAADSQDPNAVGMCVTSVCTVGAGPNRCPASTPVCSAGRCVACMSDPQCSAINPAQPYCGTTQMSPLLGMCVECRAANECTGAAAKLGCDTSVGQCKPCTLHSQCASQACAKDDTLNVSSVPVDKRIAMGECVPPSRVLTVDDTCGSSCLQNMLDRANIDSPYVLVKNYASTQSAITVRPKSGLPELHIITTTADSSPAQLQLPPTASITFQSATQGALQITAGSSVTIEGMVVFNSSIGLMCDSDSGGTAIPTSVKLIRSAIGLSDVGIRTRPKCQLTLDQSYIGMGPQPAFSMVSGGNFMTMDLDSTELTIVNSVFNHNTGKPATNTFGGILIRDTAKLTPPGRIVNSTFYRNNESYAASSSALAISCPSPISNLTIFNTLFASPAAFGKPYVDTNCRSAATFDYIATDETLPLPGPAGTHIVTVSEADLVAPGTGDVHLKKTAPAAVTAGGAMTFNGITRPKVDAGGTARSPATVSIGAFEVAPQ